MQRRRLWRTAVAVGAAAVLAGAMSPFTGPASAAAPPPDAQLTAPARTISPGVYTVAGSTGFAHSEDARKSFRWTDYATGATTTLAIPTPALGLVNTMSDLVVYSAAVGDYRLLDPHTGTVRAMRLPPEFGTPTFGGDTALAPATEGAAAGECHLFRLDGATLTDRKVTGLPADSHCALAVTPEAGAGDVSTGLVTYRAGGARHYGLVDLRTAELTELPLSGNAQYIRVTPSYVSWQDTPAHAVKVLSRGHLHDAPRSIPVGSGSLVRSFPVGDHVLRIDADNGPLLDVAPDGGTTTLLTPAYGNRALPGPDGSLLIVGRGPDGDYAVDRFTAGADGAPVRSEVLAVPWQPTHSARLALAGGDLVSYEVSSAGDGAGFYDRRLALSGAPAAVSQRPLGGGAGFGCEADQSCPEPFPAADGRLAYVTDTGSGYRLNLVDASSPAATRQIVLGADRPTVYGVSGRYVAYGTGTGKQARTEVRDLDTRAVVRTAPAGPSALWGGTLWQASAGGRLTATDVAKGTVTRTLGTGSSCAVHTLQASARYLYWECGAAAPASAGTVDIATGTARTTAVGPGPGRLGDGFIARLDGARRVVVTDLTSAKPVEQVLGTAASSVPGVGWTADPSSVLVAYTDGDQRVHAVRAGTAAPLTAVDAAVPADKDVQDEGRAWAPQWWLSKPAASWKVALRNKATGAAVPTLTGGEARGVITADWDGLISAGHPVPSGTYTWTLTAQPADGSGAALTKSGALHLTGGAAVARDYTADGVGDVLTLNSKGEFTFQHGDGAGKFSGKTTGGGWPATAVAVPFGDLDGDCSNDVLVRWSDGSLRGYRPASGQPVRPTTPYSKLGTGFQAYKTLTSPGDLTGDGRADLLGWKSSTGDLYLFASKSDGTLAAGKKIRSKWTYSKVMGVGDLNGDGYGDLLARDKAHVLWRYNGTAAGQFRERVRVFKDWGASYDTIVGVGDITGDGRADIVERDAAGNLYRNTGDGKGSFGGRTLIATGWKGYRGVF
ncbi:FG-GAP-like repeat-containing protein [Streptomyces sp. NPDC059398]|uniref:FG-GAP-like repeat-containing protein n=1 Tax=Streptomyces sp. NPDC059398 TaxID=3346820 RepID=UPI0036C2273F